MYSPPRIYKATTSTVGDPRTTLEWLFWIIPVSTARLLCPTSIVISRVKRIRIHCHRPIIRYARGSSVSPARSVPQNHLNVKRLKLLHLALQKLGKGVRQRYRPSTLRMLHLCDRAQLHPHHLQPTIRATRTRTRFAAYSMNCLKPFHRSWDWEGYNSNDN